MCADKAYTTSSFDFATANVVRPEFAGSAIVRQEAPPSSVEYIADWENTPQLARTRLREGTSASSAQPSPFGGVRRFAHDSPPSDDTWMPVRVAANKRPLPSKTSLLT